MSYEKKSINELSSKMIKALILGTIFGFLFLSLREFLINNNKTYIWEFLNNLLFQDITASSNKYSVGIFYIIGQLFINTLQLVVVPLIFCSITLSMCSITNTSKFGKIAIKTILNFLFMYILAICFASILGFFLSKTDIFKVSLNKIAVENPNSLNSNPLNIILSIIPNNILSVFTTNSRVLSIIFFSVVTGICLNRLKGKILILKDLLEDINNIIYTFLNFIINKFSPIAIFSLITRTFAIYGIIHIKPALAYILIVSICSILFLFLGYPIYIYLKTGLNPLIFLKKILKVALLGFSAASSAAALSFNKKVVTEELGVNDEITSFVLPLGMTINMNGTAIMQVIATIFIASSANYAISFQNIILIALLALIGSVGTPSIPGSSTIILFTILSSMGYNNESALIAYSLIVAINRPIDMLITTLNITGDAATAIIVAKSENLLDEDTFKN